MTEPQHTASLATAHAPVERYVELSAGRYRYLEWGDATHPTVVLLHGRTSLVETWNKVAEALAPRWHVLALEQRGHGGSPWDPEGRYDLADFLGDYRDFVARVVGGRHALIGHSMGSCTSLVYAGLHGPDVVALVLEDGGPPGPTVTSAVAEDLATSPLSFDSWATARDHVLATHAHLDEDRLSERVDQSVRPGAGGHYFWKADVQALLAPHFDELMDEGQWRATAALEMDTIFLWATRPYLVEPEVVERMGRLNERVRVIDVPTGHSIHEERLDLFLEHVIPFLESHRETK